MHAYLLVVSKEDYLIKSGELAKKLKAKILEFPLKKIDDVRSLNSFTSLKINEPTALLINSIEEATTEALNAFLKNLEEPQENLYYLLTTSNLTAILPTIISRCQVIKTNSNLKLVDNESLEKFLKNSVGQKLAYVDKIKDRGEAINFVQKLILGTHHLLHQTKKNYTEMAKNLENMSQTLNNLKANGNVNLQLTNLVINLT